MARKKSKSGPARRLRQTRTTRAPRVAAPPPTDAADAYKHSQEAVQRPDVGVQDQFTKRKPPKTYRYDSSLDPQLSWDEGGQRELAEWLLALIDRAVDESEAVVFAEPQVWKGGGVRVQSTRAAVDCLKSLSRPFLNWAGKAERHEITVPTVPLFVHERHSTKAILEGIRHRRARGTTGDLFGDQKLEVGEQLDAYEYRGPWQNRMILGDSLQVMNSLLEFEGLGSQVQMIYFDPPYGVKFGSNFQPFVRKRSVEHGGDDEMTREPEMVKAYRDTWELGLHSYLTYIRDRLLLAKELLHISGSIFVQISEDNLHHVREVLDEVFGEGNFIVCIVVKKTGSQRGKLIQAVNDYLLWYAKDREACEAYSAKLYQPLTVDDQVEEGFDVLEFADGREIRLSELLLDGEDPVIGVKRILSEHAGARLFAPNPLTSGGRRKNQSLPFVFRGRRFDPGIARGNCWKHTVRTDDGSTPGMERLGAENRLYVSKNQLRFKRYTSDFAFKELTNWWDGLGGASKPLYVVQTNSEIVKRCLLMSTRPGDLVFDPTCGSGTTAYVAEYWGRRWITCDTSRVPLALARQRLLTETYPYFTLQDPTRGPEGGFVYQRRTNRDGNEIGGRVPHITSSTIANGDPPVTEVLVDRPQKAEGVVRVSGRFVVEATIPTVQLIDPSSLETSEAGKDPDASAHLERMTQILRQSKTLQLPGNRILKLEGIRRHSSSEFIHAEALDDEGQERIAIVFGPENGAISSDLVFEAAREAYFLRYSHLYFFGFAIHAKARELLEDRTKLRIFAAYVAVTPDVAMSELLKTTRSSEIFSVTGLPDVNVSKTGKTNTDGAQLYQVELLGLDTFNPVSLEHEGTAATSLPAWMLDSDYDGMSFRAAQVFFPKTAAWDSLRKSLKDAFDPSVWEHLAGTTSEPFALGERRRVAVKVIDERGNELMRVVDVT